MEKFFALPSFSCTSTEMSVLMQSARLRPSSESSSAMARSEDIVRFARTWQMLFKATRGDESFASFARAAVAQKVQSSAYAPLTVCETGCAGGEENGADAIKRSLKRAVTTKRGVPFAGKSWGVGHNKL